MWIKKLYHAPSGGALIRSNNRATLIVTIGMVATVVLGYVVNVFIFVVIVIVILVFIFIFRLIPSQEVCK